MASTAAFPNVGREIREYSLAAAQDFPEGAAVVLASGLCQECGADPALVLGFALHAAGADPNTSKVLVALARGQSTFWIAGTTAPLAAHVGGAYGLAVDGDGDWVLDISDTTATRARVVDIDTTRNLFEISILAANRQLG